MPMCRRLIVCTLPAARPTRTHAAFQRPLQGRPLHEMGQRSIVPFLAPSDGVPFACFLILHRAAASSPREQPMLLAPAGDGVLELVYVLDGSGQVPSTPPCAHERTVCSFRRPYLPDVCVLLCSSSPLPARTPCSCILVTA